MLISRVKLAAEPLSSGFLPLFPRKRPAGIISKSFPFHTYEFRFHLHQSCANNSFAFHTYRRCPGKPFGFHTYEKMGRRRSAPGKCADPIRSSPRTESDAPFFPVDESFE